MQPDQAAVRIFVGAGFGSQPFGQRKRVVQASLGFQLIGLCGACLLPAEGPSAPQAVHPLGQLAAVLIVERAQQQAGVSARNLHVVLPALRQRQRCPPVDQRAAGDPLESEQPLAQVVQRRFDGRVRPQLLRQPLARLRAFQRQECQHGRIAPFQRMHGTTGRLQLRHAEQP